MMIFSIYELGCDVNIIGFVIYLFGIVECVVVAIEPDWNLL